MDENTKILSNKKAVGTFIAIFLVALVTTTSIGYFFLSPSSDTTESSAVGEYEVSYEITTIPYVGALNNKGYYRQSYSRTVIAATLISVLEYWFPRANDMKAIDGLFASATESSDFGIVQTYLEVEDDRLDSHSEFLTLSQIGRYANEERTIPLITNLPAMVAVEGEAAYEQMTLVVGLDTENNTITLQNYWLGRYTITLDEYEELQESSVNLNEYLVIYPKSNGESERPLTDFSDQYPVLTLEERTFFANYAKADALRLSSIPETAIPYYAAAYQSPVFDEYVPPIMRVIMLSRYAGTLYQIERYEEARALIVDTLTFNNNLDEPFGTFASYDYLFNNTVSNAEGYRDTLSFPHIVAGDIYRAIDQPLAAIDEYETALTIFPQHNGPKVMLERLRKENPA